MAYLSYNTGYRACDSSYSRNNRIGNEFMKNPEVLNMQQILLEKKFARKKKASLKNLCLLLVIFLSLLVIKTNEVVQADILSLHTAAGAVSYSNRLDDGKR